MSAVDFEFELGKRVRIAVSGEAGEVIGRAEYAHCNDSYLVRYKSGDGRAVESWWDVTALVAADS